MVPINEIRNRIKNGDYRFSEHAVKRMIKRSIENFEIEEVLSNGEIIEEYPDDKYAPSCLIYGTTTDGRNLHVQLSVSPVVIITLYEPDSDEWIDSKIRRQSK